MKPIMQTSCNGIICHGAPGQPAEYNTDFFNPPAGQTLEQMLIGKAANYSLVADPSTCPKDKPELLVDPTTPSESLILKKIKGTQTCGVRMPSTKNALTQEQIDCFVNWVNAITGNRNAGGAAAGGASSGHTASGGSASGGTGTGRTASGGSANGGSGTGRTTSGGAASGGATASGTVSDIPPTFATVKTILTENVTPCVGSDCHGGHPGRISLLVDSGLLGRLTSSTSKVCGMPVVDPGKPSNSALVKVLREGCGNVSPNCLVGTACIPRMPMGCTDGFDCIAENYMAAIEKWIADGAAP